MGPDCFWLAPPSAMAAACDKSGLGAAFLLGGEENDARSDRTSVSSTALKAACVTEGVAAGIVEDIENLNTGCDELID